MVLQCAIGWTILPALFRSTGEARLLVRSKEVRTILKWQLIATVVIAGVSWPFSGPAGVVSALLGGAINLIAGLVLFAVASLGRQKTAGEVVLRVIRAELSKVVFIIIALWVSMTRYKGLVHVPFFVAFGLTALLPAVAFTGRREQPVSTDRQ
jgi:F0F1-type ATP synthase assembly protein I